nr:hypothetical protein CFP56_48934 [Quercus suber]
MRMDFNLDHGFAHWHQKGNRKKDTRNSYSDRQDDEEDDIQSLAEDEEGDYPILSDLVGISSDSNLNLKDNLYNSHVSKHWDKAETNVIEKAELALSNKAPHINYSNLEKEARNFETPFEKLSNIYEDIKMESSSNIVAEILELKTTSLRSWKQISMDKKNLNVTDSSTSMPVHATQLVGEADTITEPDIGHKQKKQLVEKDNFQSSTPTTEVGTQPLVNP